MKAFWDPAQLDHDPVFFLQRGVVKQNFERPDRALALLSGCQALRMDVVQPPAAPRAALEAVHSPAYLNFLRDAAPAWARLADHGPELVPNIHPSAEMLANGAQPSGTIVGQLGWFTADTSCPIGTHTWTASLAAAAGAIAAADEASSGRHAYALARPPGHHAYAAKAGGHCYLNNAAIAAQRLRANGADNVAILDIDCHHGNGTQGIFWERSDVFFASIHGDPNAYYPWYVGHASERGAKLGFGSTLNLPLPQGAGDTEWLAGIDTALAAIKRFGADAIIVSLGFDASEHEPLHFLSVSEAGFARAGAAIAASGRPCAIVQEGGYNTDLLGGLLMRFFSAF